MMVVGSPQILTLESYWRVGALSLTVSKKASFLGRFLFSVAPRQTATWPELLFVGDVTPLV